jgi:hypothetical protein
MLPFQTHAFTCHCTAVDDAMRTVNFDRKYAAAVEILRDAANQGLATGNSPLNSHAAAVILLILCCHYSAIQPWRHVRDR